MPKTKTAANTVKYLLSLSHNYSIDALYLQKLVTVSKSHDKQWSNLSDAEYILKCIHNYGGTVTESIIDRLHNILG